MIPHQPAEKKRAHITLPASFFPAVDCAQTTIALPIEVQRRLSRTLGMRPGDTVVLEDPLNQRELVGRLLVKPTDCLLIEEDTRTEG